jgi:hypothetical protein
MSNPSNVPVKNKLFYYPPTLISVPNICINDLENSVEKILCENKKIKLVKLQNFIYYVEYYPVEGIQIHPKTEIHKQKQTAISNCTHKALEMFPDNVPIFDSKYIPIPIRYGDKISFENWCSMKLNIIYDPEKNSYILELIRAGGNAGAFYKIFRLLQDNLKKEILWLKRKSYISLMEGVEIKCGKENHIEKYLFNELICREVSSFMEYSNPYSDHFSMKEYI